jgi:RNA polymerase sigma factor (sigma-70 family)
MPSSIERVFQTWYPRLVRFGRRRLGSPDDAEDVAQEAFARLIDEKEPPRNSPAWLFTVAGHLVADRDRATARRDRLAGQRAVQLLPDEPEDAPDRNVERAESVAAVRRVLATLGERDRRLLLLYHDGLSYRDLASELGVRASSIGPLLYRAHRRFVASYHESQQAS